MSWFPLQYCDLHPHATAARWLAVWLGHLESAARRARGLTSRLLPCRDALATTLERRLGRVRFDPEVASLAFFLILIALTFLV